MGNQTVRKTLHEVASTLPSNREGVKTTTEIVIMMDGTGSMQNAIDSAKDTAMTLHRRIWDALDEKNRLSDEIRVKVIVFRDVYVDSEPFIESDFFVLRKDGNGDERDFHRFIANIRANGGGDEPENALEALHMAMNEPFTQPLQGERARHIIVMLTDASAHPLNHPRRAGCGNYPQGVPEDLVGLQAEWEEKMDTASRRLLIFAPNAYPWTSIASWMDTQFVPSTAGKGIDRERFDEVIKAIAGSTR